MLLPRRVSAPGNYPLYIPVHISVSSRSTSNNALYLCIYGPPYVLLDLLFLSVYRPLISSLVKPAMSVRLCVCDNSYLYVLESLLQIPFSLSVLVCLNISPPFNLTDTLFRMTIN